MTGVLWAIPCHLRDRCESGSGACASGGLWRRETGQFALTGNNDRRVFPDIVSLSAIDSGMLACHHLGSGHLAPAQASRLAQLATSWPHGKCC